MTLRYLPFWVYVFPLCSSNQYPRITFHESITLCFEYDVYVIENYVSFITDFSVSATKMTENIGRKMATMTKMMMTTMMIIMMTTMMMMMMMMMTTTTMMIAQSHGHTVKLSQIS
jgi:hypothetical protein